MKRTRRNHGAAFKTQVAFAAVKGEKTLAELVPQFGVHPTQITEWKPQLLARAVDVCGGTKATLDAPDRRAPSGLSVYRSPHVARPLTERRSQDRTQAGAYPDGP